MLLTLKTLQKKTSFWNLMPPDFIKKNNKTLQKIKKSAKNTK